MGMMPILIIEILLIDWFPFCRKKKKDEGKEESIAKMALRNSNIWEARLNMMEHAREHFRWK